MRAINARLRKTQEEFRPKPRRAPLDELILTVLSQATSDTNRDRAFAGLKQRFSTWDDVLAAPVGAIADAIRPGGIAERKAPRIKAILAEVEEREGRLDLKRLTRMEDAEIVDYLCSLPGVGPKTTACVLVFSLGRDAFPIDTHVERVLKRLALIPVSMSAAAAHRDFAPLVPEPIRYEFHMRLITHGRTTCTARSPACSRCVLLDLCPSGPRLLHAGDAR